MTTEIRYKFNTASMWLVYRDDEGNFHEQPWQDIMEVGVLIDPETGNDWEIIGWRVP